VTSADRWATKAEGLYNQPTQKVRRMKSSKSISLMDKLRQQ